MPGSARILLVGALGLALGLAGGVLLARPAAQTQPAATGTADDEAQELLRERRARVALEAQVRALEEALEVAGGGPADGAQAPAPEAPAAGAAPAVAAAEAPDAPRIAALEALGFTASEIRRLLERHEQLELDRVYLRNQAQREGWLQRPRFQRELQALRGEAIDELGERDYDAMLYAAGRNNRVIVSRLLANSPAEVAGLQPGDALLRYGGRRIFDTATIVREAATGRVGELTELRIERRGEELRLFLPRGPLGVVLRPGRRPPDRIR